MKKFLLFFAVMIFGFTSETNAQNTSSNDSLWDILDFEGDTLRLYEEEPGKIAINTEDWKENMKFPVYVKSLKGNTLEYLENESMASFGAISIFLDPFSVSPSGVRKYEFVILSGINGGETTWWIQEYIPNKNPGA